MLKKVAALFVVALLASPVLAQTQSQPPATSTWSGLPDRFQIDAGIFQVSADSVLRANVGTGAGSDVNFERDLGLSKGATTYWVDARWHPWRRHQLSLSYTSIQRDNGGKTLDRSFTWNGQVYDAGLEASATSTSTILAAIYRFSLIKRDRFEFGPAAGLGMVSLSANISAQGTVVSGGVPVTKSLNESRSGRYPTGDVGAFVSIWVTRKAVIRGDFLYIYVAPGDSVASVADGRLALDYYPWRHVGFGLQYKYNQFRYDQGANGSSLGGTVTFQGGQLYASFLF